VTGISTNSLEVFVIRKQAETDQELREIIKKEGRALYTKGLMAKIQLCVYQSIFVFMTLNYFSRMFDTDLDD